MMARTLHALIVLLVGTLSIDAHPANEAPKKAAAKKPLHALLITGGCCHDYKFQSKQLVEASEQYANVKWTVLQDPRRGTRGKIDLYNDPNWAKPYDVVVHNECFAATSDPEYVRKITSVHHAGVPAVVIHCAMHTYRSAKIDDWREFLGVTSRHHEHQSEYPVEVVMKDHPIMQGFPLDWKSPKDELYVIQKVWPKTKILATSKSERNGKSHGVFWTNQYGKARVFGTTYGHGNPTFRDAVFLDTVTRGLLWSTGKLAPNGQPVSGYEPVAKPVSRNWAAELVAKKGAKEAPVALFNGKDLKGWVGTKGLWSVEGGEIVGRNEKPVKTSTYLFTEQSYREFRLVFEVKQARSKKHSTMHSAVAALGERFDDKGNAFGFKGPLLMFCQDWGIWDAYRRNRTEPKGHRGTFHPKGVERVGEWNQIEILVRGNRIRFAANGKLVFDFTDDPSLLKKSPIGLQLHSNRRPQEFRFRGLVLTTKPSDDLWTVSQSKKSKK
ncbi:MAG: ThuA domain-containing protein [Planctomycetota bacterium]